MKNIKLPTKPEILNLITAAIGILMIICSVMFIVEQESFDSKILNIIGDLGVGIFPTGVIGFVLERMQNRSEEKQKNNKRSSVLRLFNNSVHMYLNSVCNNAVMSNRDLRGKKVLDIIKIIRTDNIEIESTIDEKKALVLLLDRLSASFESTNPLFIVADVFDAIEINYFEMLLREGRYLLNLINEGGEIIDIRNRFLEELEISSLKISGCENFNDMVSDGDNIYIPRK